VGALKNEVALLSSGSVNQLGLAILAVAVSIAITSNAPFLKTSGGGLPEKELVESKLETNICEGVLLHHQIELTSARRCHRKG